MTCPASIVVGPKTYVVAVDRAAINAESVSNGAQLDGCTDHAKQVISIAPDLGADHERMVVLHETLHGITDQTGIAFELGPQDEEKFVNRIAPALLDVLRRNPKLVAYLTA